MCIVSGATIEVEKWDKSKRNPKWSYTSYGDFETKSFPDIVVIKPEIGSKDIHKRFPFSRKKNWPQTCKKFQFKFSNVTLCYKIKVRF